MDSHSVIVKSLILEEFQIKNAIGVAFDDADKYLKSVGDTRPLIRTYLLDKVSDYKNVYNGYSFVYFDDSRMWWLLLGYDENGKRRFKEEDELELDFSMPMNWADEPEPVPAEPLIELKATNFTPKQLTERQYFFDRWVEHKKITDIPPLPTCVTFTVSAVRAEVKKDCSSSILFCPKVPSWIDNNDLFRLLGRFASDKIERRDERGNLFRYPKIDRKANGTVYIMFDPSKNDGCFAFNFCRKLFLSKDVAGRKMTVTEPIVFKMARLIGRD